MSSAKTATPAEVQALVAEGYVYVDVRTEAEFVTGHPPGALNVPASSKGVPNPEFVPVLERALGKDAKIVLGCQSGPRSKRAAEALLKAGFTDVVEMPAGMAGGRDAFGRPLAGWVAQGLPVETGTPAGQSYGDVKARTR
ncbi:MAG TPA: rhodanese-like domain-containing protein [Polyangiaceae bacterium]|jgi:rhodanese-related sulfurtransferase